jgi:hypothetical protein
VHVRLCVRQYWRLLILTVADLVTVLSVVVQPGFCWYTAEHGNTLAIKEACLKEVQRQGVTDCYKSTFLVKWVDDQITAYEKWQQEDDPTGNPTNPWLAVQKDIQTLSDLRGKLQFNRESKKGSAKKSKKSKEQAEKVRTFVSCVAWGLSTNHHLRSTRTKSTKSARPIALTRRTRRTRMEMTTARC